MLFALVAGAGTALSPCVLPVLPAVLSAGVTGGRRRPLGVVIGLALSFTFATVALVYVIAALGLPDDFIRTLAIVTLAVFGVLLLVPPLADRVEAWISRVAPGPGAGGAATGSAPGCSWARASASSTRRAPGRSSPGSSRSRPRRTSPSAGWRSRLPTRSARRRCSTR